LRNSRRRSAANWHVKLSGQGGRSRRNARIAPLIDPTLWWEHLALRTELVLSIHIVIVLNPVWCVNLRCPVSGLDAWHTSSLRCLRVSMCLLPLPMTTSTQNGLASRAGSTSSLAAPSSPRMCSGRSGAPHIPDPHLSAQGAQPQSMGRVPVRFDRVRNADRKTAPERVHEVHET
jgi:hypothetical protein